MKKRNRRIQIIVLSFLGMILLAGCQNDMIHPVESIESAQNDLAIETATLEDHTTGSGWMKRVLI